MQDRGILSADRNVVPKTSFQKRMTRNGSPQGASPNAKSVGLLGYFFVHSHYLPLRLPSPLFPPTSSLSHFGPSLFFPKEMNKKLSYRGQNAFRMITRSSAVAERPCDTSCHCMACVSPY